MTPTIIINRKAFEQIKRLQENMFCLLESIQDTCPHKETVTEGEGCSDGHYERVTRCAACDKRLRWELPN